jgi:hypothetical protein
VHLEIIGRSYYGKSAFEDEEVEKQPRITPLLPYMRKKGQSGNPAGRPKGKTIQPLRICVQ